VKVLFKSIEDATVLLCWESVNYYLEIIEVLNVVVQRQVHLV